MSQRYPGHLTRKMNRKHMHFNKRRTLKQRGRQYIPTRQRIRDVKQDMILAKKMAKDRSQVKQIAVAVFDPSTDGTLATNASYGARTTTAGGGQTGNGEGSGHSGGGG